MLLQVVLVGCETTDGDISHSAPVRGTISYRGKPLEHGVIVFLHSSGQAVGAEIQSDGTYSIDAFLGENRISVVSRNPDVSNPGGRPAMLPGEDLIPGIYGDFETSGLMSKVVAGENVKDIGLGD